MTTRISNRLILLFEQLFNSTNYHISRLLKWSSQLNREFKIQLYNSINRHQSTDVIVQANKEFITRLFRHQLIDGNEQSTESINITV